MRQNFEENLVNDRQKDKAKSRKQTKRMTTIKKMKIGQGYIENLDSSDSSESEGADVRRLGVDSKPSVRRDENNAENWYDYDPMRNVSGEDLGSQYSRGSVQNIYVNNQGGRHMSNVSDHRG